MNAETTIVEINGVKLEVDLRKARVIHDNIKVGSRVKLLEKSAYGGPEVFAGIVAAFEPFESLPTIVVAYVKNAYGETNFVNFAYINASDKSKEKWEMVPSQDDDMPIARENIMAGFEREIQKREQEILGLQTRRDYFVRNFGEYFRSTETA
ncbi:MAG TPA: hypothetical protein VFW94_03695 [Candidatus Acidoferrales bacterium]|jgi:hypothetical protein|nr:hypothetical protein [Candidatus Acidoferrales bacterium]